MTFSPSYRSGNFLICHILYSLTLPRTPDECQRYKRLPSRKSIQVNNMGELCWIASLMGPGEDTYCDARRWEMGEATESATCVETMRLTRQEL